MTLAKGNVFEKLEEILDKTNKAVYDGSLPIKILGDKVVALKPQLSKNAGSIKQIKDIHKVEQESLSQKLESRESFDGSQELCIQRLVQNRNPWTSLVSRRG